MLQNFNLPTRDLVIGAVFVFVLGLVTGIVPAVQAMRLKIADALRRQT
jgi:putative ABC transport system permease protein